MDIRQPKDLVSFNKELMDLNFDDITVEDLDRRIELAIGLLPTLESCECPLLTTCIMYCLS